MAEMMLRLGCGLVGWLLVFSHGLLLAVVPHADCSPQLWTSTTLFAGLAAVSALWLLPAGLQWQSYLRWLCLPAAGLWLLGVGAAWPLLSPATFSGVELCAALQQTEGPVAPPWQRYWAPFQLAVIAGCAWQAARYWRPLAPTPARAP